MMRLAMLAFMAGVIFLHTHVQLPDIPVLIFSSAGALGSLVVALLLRFLSSSYQYKVTHTRLNFYLKHYLNLILSRLPQLLLLIACFLSAYIYTAYCAHMRLADALDPALEGKNIALQLRIVGLPTYLQNGYRFEALSVNPMKGIPSRLSMSWYPKAVNVTDLKPGQIWFAQVRLRRPYGTVNPHGFDYEAWLFEHGIRASGTVELNVEPLLLQDQPCAVFESCINFVRYKIRKRLFDVLDSHSYAGVIAALVIGDQASIRSSDWALFNRTGISHLVSISGLHVTMVAAALGLLMNFLWRRLRWRHYVFAQYMPAQQVSAAAACLTAWVYCLLAGWGVPSRRTFIMLAIVCLAQMLRQPLSPSRILIAALTGVTLLDPWAPLAAGFWLSFGAVAVIFFVTTTKVNLLPHRGWRHALHQATHIQLAVTAALVPATIFLFQQVSIIGPLANAIAIPLVSWVITPLALLGAIWPSAPPFNWMLLIAHQLFVCLMWVLECLSLLPAASVSIAAPPIWTLFLALLGLIWLLAPPGWPVRLAGLCMLLPALTYKPEVPPVGEWRMTVLDVGQGSAVLIETAQHQLLFDTGPRYSADADAGERVVVPYMRALGIHELDGVIVSHEDADHAGGLNAILVNTQVKQLWTGFPLTLPVLPSLAEKRWAFFHSLALYLGIYPSGTKGIDLNSYKPDLKKSIQVNACQAGIQWVWDEVSFEFLHPQADGYLNPLSSHSFTKPSAQHPTANISERFLPSANKSNVLSAAQLQKNSFSTTTDFIKPVERQQRNARSCVLKVTALKSGMRALLTADIEREQEQQLLSQTQTRTLLGTDVLLVAHHGSATSSTQAFIEQVRPKIAIIQAGYRNRYGHPVSAVVQRFIASGAKVYRTDRDGALVIASQPLAINSDSNTQVNPNGLSLKGIRIERAHYWNTSWHES